MFTTPSAVPTAAVVHPSFQIMNTTNNHHTLVSSSSSSTNTPWHLTTPTSPSVVSILNGNNSTLYIATQPTTTTSLSGNIIRQSPQTVRFVSPSFTLINNSNTIITGHVPIISSSNNNNNNSQSGICIDSSVLGRLTTSTTQRQENFEEQVDKKNKTKNF
jgi:hypothetical protein